MDQGSGSVGGDRDGVGAGRAAVGVAGGQHDRVGGGGVQAADRDAGTGAVAARPRPADGAVDAQDARPGGAVVVTTPNLAYLGNRIRLLLGRDLHHLTIDRGDVGNQHIRVFTLRLLRHLLDEAGFDIVDVGSDGVVLNLERFIRVEWPRTDAPASSELQPAQAVVPLTAWPLPTLGRTLYVKALRRARSAGGEARPSTTAVIPEPEEQWPLKTNS